MGEPTGGKGRKAQGFLGLKCYQRRTCKATDTFMQKSSHRAGSPCNFFQRGRSFRANVVALKGNRRNQATQTLPLRTVILVFVPISKQGEFS
jgi:hypothetical protein